MSEQEGEHELEVELLVGQICYKVADDVIADHTNVAAPQVLFAPNPHALHCLEG